MQDQALLTVESALARSARLLSPTVVLVCGCIAILIRLKSGWTARHASSAGTHSNTLCQNPRPRHRARRSRILRTIQLALGVLLGLFVFLSDGVSAQPLQAAAEGADEYLEWRSGQFSIVAQFVVIEGESVILQRKDNNQRITVPLKVLDPASQQQARDCHQASLNPMEDSGTKPVEPKSTPKRTDPSEPQEVPIPANTIITGLRQSKPPQRLLALHGEKLDLPDSGRQITYETVIRNNGKERRTYYLQWQKDGRADGEIREIVVGPSSEVAAEHTTIFNGPRLPVMGVTVVDESNAEILKGAIESQVTLPLHSASITVLVDRDVAKLIEDRTGISVYDWINEQFRLQTELFKNSKSTKHPGGCPLIVRPARIDVLPKAALDKRAALLVRGQEPFIIIDPLCLAPQAESSTVGASAVVFYRVDRELGLVPRGFRSLVASLFDFAVRGDGAITGAKVNLPAYIPNGYRQQEKAYGSTQVADGATRSQNAFERLILESLLPLNQKQVEWLTMRMEEDGFLRPGLPLGFDYIETPSGIAAKFHLASGEIDPGAKYGFHVAHGTHSPRYGEPSYHTLTSGRRETLLAGLKRGLDSHMMVAVNPPGARSLRISPCGIEIDRTPYGYQGKHEPLHGAFQVYWSDGTQEFWLIGYRELERTGGPLNDRGYVPITLVKGTGIAIVSTGPGRYVVPPQYWQGVDRDNEMAAPGQGAGAQGIRGRN